MALEIVSEGDQHQAALIHCETLDTVEAFQGVFDDLIAAWELYFSSPDMYYLLPSVLENGVHTNEAGIGDHWPEILVDYYPGNWQEHAADLPPLTFWDRVAAFPACWPAASTFLETILSFNDREPDDPYAYEGWEEDESRRSATDTAGVTRPKSCSSPARRSMGNTAPSRSSLNSETSSKPTAVRSTAALSSAVW